MIAAGFLFAEIPRSDGGTRVTAPHSHTHA